MSGVIDILSVASTFILRLLNSDSFISLSSVDSNVSYIEIGYVKIERGGKKKVEPKIECTLPGFVVTVLVFDRIRKSFSGSKCEQLSCEEFEVLISLSNMGVTLNGS
ncbi:25162_t:CDS:1 [Cetraspora pellucida]|uniref:25162_t:CDS:1 n=1 Tax=Cetraspora pellucida TaxID=1433469 RepID=A0A9N9P2U5_9GLOM|nr:25162_t:CDS:1 [Cetraspora pellucida]